MKEKQKIILIIILLFLIYLLVAFFDDIKNLKIQSEEIKKELNVQKIKQDDLIKKNKERVVFKDKILQVDDLLDVSNWEDYENRYIKFKYPKDIYIFERVMYQEELDAGILANIRITPTKEPGSPNDRSKIGSEIPWFMLDFNILENKSKLSLIDWLLSRDFIRYSNINYTFIKIKIGESIFFSDAEIINEKIINNNIEKIYKLLPNESIFNAYFILQVEDKNFSKIFYTILSTLEFKDNK